MKKTQISLTGLGYVGLPLAVEFAKHFEVVGFDANPKRIEELKSGFDRSNEVESKQLSETQIEFSSDPGILAKANFHVVAVPTPIDGANQPDLEVLLAATQTIASYLKSGDTVVFESTVYPGLTEEKCQPILEKISGLKAGKDFMLGYSPERINPGDKQHTLTQITKVVSGCDEPSLEYIAHVYGQIIEAGVYRAPNIKTAEAAKVIENTQRDLNIAFVNELALLFNKLGIDTQEVLKAASTKWNFLDFKPGLVGGHCIGVDPYYLTHKAEQVGYHPQVILAGRRINDQMGDYVARQCVLELAKVGASLKGAKVGILGITFKENCPDIRNTRVIDIINSLKEYNINPIVHDPMANSSEVSEAYHLELQDFEQLKDLDALILAVPHEKYLNIEARDLEKKLKVNGVILDIKGVLSKENLSENRQLWRL